RFDVLGNTLKLFVNGNLVATALDNVLQAPGLTGIRGSAASLDNFSAKQLFSTLPFSDSFTPPNSTNLGTDYLERAGNLQLQSHLLAPASGGLNLAVYSGAFETDVSVQANIAVPPTGFGYAGLMARYRGDGDNNMYQGSIVGIDGHYLAVIYRNVN